MSKAQSWSRTRNSLDLLVVATLVVAGTFAVLAEGAVSPFAEALPAVAFLTEETLPQVVRVPLGIVFVLFAPGYALVSLLCPRETIGGTDGEEGRRVTTVERLVLSVGLSVVIVPMVGIVLNYTEWGVGRTQMVLSIGLVTFLLTELAIGRRLGVPASERFHPGLFGVPERVREWVVVHERKRATVLNAVLVVGLVVAAAGVGIAVATNGNGERYTELYLLTEDAESGELVADGYPEELTVGEPTDLHVGITNQEQETVTYTVVVQLQRIDREGGYPRVAERFNLDAFEVTLANGETAERRHAVEPVVEGTDLRLTYLLYEGSPPATPSVDSASRSVHLWVDVTAPEGSASQSASLQDRDEPPVDDKPEDQKADDDEQPEQAPPVGRFVRRGV